MCDWNWKCVEISVCDRSERRLIFITVPNVFVNMAGGRVWGALFFLFRTFASFSTVIAVFENVMSLLLPLGSLVYLLFCVTKWGWGFDRYMEEPNTGEGLRIAAKLKPYFQ